MLLKVVTVLSVISLLGGLANCQGAPKDDYDNIIQIIQTIINEGNGSDKKHDNELNKYLIELIRAVTNRVDSMSPAPDANKLFEQLMELLNPSHEKPHEQITMEERDILSKVEQYLDHETMKDLLELIKYPKGSFHSIMMTIINRLEKEAKNRVIHMYTEYLTRTPGPGDEKKKNETMPCWKQSCRKMEYEMEMSPFLKIMKLQGWKFLFNKEHDYKRFAEMVKYIEESNGPMAWLNHLFMATEGNKWIWTIGHQILYMLENNKDMRHKLKYFIKDHRDLREIMVKASKWVKSKDFAMSSSVVKRVVNVLEMMGFDAYYNATKTLWLDDYMDWVDCNFGKQEEIAALMKSIGVMLKNDDPLRNFFHMLDFNPDYMINVTLQIMFSGTIQCNKTVAVTPQILRNLLYVVIGNDNFCTTKGFTAYTRQSTVTNESGEFLKKLSDISNTGSQMWRIAIYKNGQMEYEDVDLNYMPSNGDVIYFSYESIPTR